MISFTIQINDPDDSDIAVLQNFVRSRNLNHLDRKREGGDAEAPEARPADANDPLSAGITSDDREAKRELLRLLKEFERRDWQIPKKEIPELNREVFAKRHLQRAPVLYAKRSGYFTFDSKSAIYVATEKAKQEFQRLEEAQGKEIAIRIKSGGDYSGEKNIDTNFWDPRFMEGRLAKLASARESFFSDLTVEGIEKLDATFTRGELDEARAWIESIVVHMIDMCGTLSDLFGSFQDFPKLLDFAVQSAKEEARTRQEIAAANSSKN
jgi:hypothetical protein